jgi:hypothetical protein
MDDNDIARLGAMAHALRPDWPAASVSTWLRRNLNDKPLRDVAIALAWIACEPNSATPARLLAAPGPWWQAAGVTSSVPVPAVHEVLSPDERCTICGKSYDRCTRDPNSGHDFVSERDHAADPSTQQRDLGALVDVERHQAREEDALLDGKPGKAEFHRSRADVARTRGGWQ